jgi:hypothetical protein
VDVRRLVAGAGVTGSTARMSRQEAGMPSERAAAQKRCAAPSHLGCRRGASSHLPMSGSGRSL